MGLTRISGDVIQTPLNVGVVTATRIDGNVSGNVNSTGVSTFTTLKVGTGVTISGGIVTATTFSGNLTGNVTGNATGLSGTPNITVGAITASSAVISGNVSVAGTITYEDTTNVDSIGVITARSGIHVTGGSVGIGTINPSESLHLLKSGATSTNIRFQNSSGNVFVGNDNDGDAFVSADTNGKNIKLYTSGTERLRIDSNGHTLPGADNTYDLGASGTRWRNIYTADLQMSNEGSKNDVDGTWGKYTIQEGENDLFLINRRTGKRYKFLLEEVK